MPHHLKAELVVAHLAEDVAIANRNEVIELVDTAITGKGQDALFGKQVVEFELAQLDVEPGAAE